MSACSSEQWDITCRIDFGFKEETAQWTHYFTACTLDCLLFNGWCRRQYARSRRERDLGLCRYGRERYGRSDGCDFIVCRFVSFLLRCLLSLCKIFLCFLFSFLFVLQYSNSCTTSSDWTFHVCGYIASSSPWRCFRLSRRPYYYSTYYIHITPCTIQ